MVFRAASRIAANGRFQVYVRRRSKLPFSAGLWQVSASPPRCTPNEKVADSFALYLRLGSCATPGPGPRREFRYSAPVPVPVL